MASTAQRAANKRYYEKNKKLVNLKIWQKRKKLMELGKFHLKNCEPKTENTISPTEEIK